MCASRCAWTVQEARIIAQQLEGDAKLQQFRETTDGSLSSLSPSADSTGNAAGAASATPVDGSAAGTNVGVEGTEAVGHLLDLLSRGQRVGPSEIKSALAADAKAWHEDDAPGGGRSSGDSPSGSSLSAETEAPHERCCNRSQTARVSAGGRERARERGSGSIAMPPLARPTQDTEW